MWYLPGKYLCDELKVPSSITLRGTHGWGYRDIGGSVLLLNSPENTCLLNLTGAHGSKISGLQILGEEKGSNVHGIYVKWDLYNGNGATFFDGYTTDFHEDSILIDDCQIRSFSGNGIHLDHIFAFTIRNTHVIRNLGNGIYIDGWDGWISNSIISFNDGYALAGKSNCSSITFTGNRIEWNRLGGFYFENGANIIINSNSFDRNMGPAIYMPKTEWRGRFIINGNVFWRNGKPRKTPFEDELLSSHIYMDTCSKSVISNNTMGKGIDDGGAGEISPNYGIVIKNSTTSIIKDNIISSGAVLEEIKLENNSECIIKDNC